MSLGPEQSGNSHKSYVKHFRNGTSLDMSYISTSDTDRYSAYSDWRKACNYNREQNECFVNFISTNSKLYSFEQCMENLNKCIAANIPPNHLLISMLYLSFHHFSPHCTNIIKYILNNYNDNVNLYATSISSPQYGIPHVAAMNGDISLLQIFYNLNGDINIKDGRVISNRNICLSKIFTIL